LGKNVVVVEFAGRLLPRQLDKEGAEILKRLLEEKGLSFVLADTVTKIEGEGKVEKVILKSGKNIKAEAVIISSGIRGRDKLAQEANIKINKGIVVDDFLQTSIENIYCAGDPLEHNGKLYGLWPAAREQGRVAGLNMAKVGTKYSGTMISCFLKVTGIELYSAGDFSLENAEVFSLKEKNVYKKFLFKDSQPIGTIVLGDQKAINMASAVFAGKKTAEEFKKYLIKGGDKNALW
jgi:nitrite reductase (NADH) large subunit